MIELYVGDRRLDIPNNDLQFHFSSMFFSGKLIDDYSIDFEIPRTKNNEEILNPSGALYRSQLFGKGMSCLLVTNHGTSNVALQVSEIAEKTITIAVFKEIIPDEIMSAKVGDIIHDDTTTIFDYPSALDTSTPAEPNVDAGLFPFVMSNTTEIVPAYYFPSIRVDKVMRMLASATGLTFPNVDETLYLTATNANYCPYDDYHYIYLAREEVDKVRDIDGGTPYATSEYSRLKRHYDITYNRSMHVVANIEAFVGFAGGAPIPSIGAIARISRITPSGSAVKLYELKVSSPNKYNTSTFEFNVGSGEVIRYECVVTDGGTINKYDNTATFFLKYKNVSRDEKYSYNLSRIPVSLGKTPDRFPQLAKHYFNRFGTISNLNEITIKDLLTAVCWQLGKRLEFDGENITLEEIYKSKKITAEVMSIAPISDALGTTTTLTDANDRLLIKKAFDNSFLNKEKIIFKSPLYYTQRAEEKTYMTIPLYGFGEDGFELMEIKGVPISKALKFTKYVLSELSPMPHAVEMLNSFGKILEITATTFDDIRGYRYVTIDGLKFAVIEGDYDVESGQTEFTALQVYEEIEEVAEVDKLLFDDGSYATFDDNDYITF